MAARLPHEQLVGLLADLRSVERGEQTPDDLASAAPDDTIRRFWDIVPRGRNELYQFVTAVAAILALVLTVLNDGESASPEQVERIVETVMRETPRSAPDEAQESSEETAPSQQSPPVEAPGPATKAGG